MVKAKKLFQQLFFFALLIILQSSFIRAQVIKKDTITLNDNSIESIIRYSANDTIHTDLKSRKVHLSGNAKVQMEDITINAGYILIDFNNDEINASYRLDKDSLKIELPNFTDGNEVIVCETLRYNIKTKRGYLKELAIKQDELYFLMKTAKRHSNDEIHLKQGKLSTCDLISPHYHFQLSKGIIMPFDN